MRWGPRAAEPAFQHPWQRPELWVPEVISWHPYEGTEPKKKRQLRMATEFLLVKECQHKT